jgi:hypothetical protein
MSLKTRFLTFWSRLQLMILGGTAVKVSVRPAFLRIGAGGGVVQASNIFAFIEEVALEFSEV